MHCFVDEHNGNTAHTNVNCHNKWNRKGPKAVHIMQFLTVGL